MSNSIFNTPFETMLRLLMLLSEAGAPMDKDKIAALDFISIYARSCGLMDSNINGENRFNFAEFAQKRELVSDALAEAVRRDLVSVSTGEDGFSYSLNERGRDVAAKAASAYADRYYEASSRVLEELGYMTGIELLDFINGKANEAKDGGYAELLD